jgi:hypothetical protein
MPNCEGQLATLEISNHGSEFVNLEWEKSSPDAHLSKDHRPVRVKFDEHGNDPQQGRNNEQT